MKNRPFSLKVIATAIVVSFMAFASLRSYAGPVFITGHDPDFHAQVETGAKTLLKVGVEYAAGGALTSANRMLWVESSIAVPGGHLRGWNGLTAIGLSNGIEFDVVDGAGLLTADLSLYSSIGVASSFGGTLTAVELDALVTRKADLQTFINSGGGLFASAECTSSSSPSNCGAGLLDASSNAPFSYLPVSVTSIAVVQSFTVTAFGSGLGLNGSHVASPTHNAFGVIGGLNIVDFDANGNAVTLAGNVTVDDGGFTPVPEPGATVLLMLGLSGLILRRKQSTQKN